MVLVVSDFYRIQAKGNNALRLSYVEWIDQWIEQGRRPYLMTFMFNRMAASSMNLFVEIMYADIEIAYRRLSGRFAHHPEKPGQRDKLPIFIGAPTRRASSVAITNSKGTTGSMFMAFS